MDTVTYGRLGLEDGMFKNKKKKGEYGYIANQRKWEIAKTAFLFALSLAIYLTGYISTGTNKNLLSIVAVLGCLPASMCAVNMILFLRAKGCPASLHDEISAHSEGLSQLYDCVFTSYERTYELPHLVFGQNALIGIAVNPKCKIPECEKHLQSMLQKGGIKDVTVKVFQDVPKYLKRLDQLQELGGEDPLTDAVFSLLKAISI